MSKKYCPKCQTEKGLNEFHRHATEKYGRYPYCKICRAAYNKQQRRTAPGLIKKIYGAMQSRVRGVIKEKAHIYAGLPIVPRREFYAWAEEDEGFKILYKAWVQSGFIYKLTPSIDRRDPCKGYTFDNMRWLTLSENSRGGGHARHR